MRLWELLCAFEVPLNWCVEWIWVVCLKLFLDVFSSAPCTRMISRNMEQNSSHVSASPHVWRKTMYICYLPLPTPRLLARATISSSQISVLFFKKPVQIIHDHSVIKHGIGKSPMKALMGKSWINSGCCIAVVWRPEGNCQSSNSPSPSVMCAAFWLQPAWKQDLHHSTSVRRREIFIDVIPWAPQQEKNEVKSRQTIPGWWFQTLWNILVSWDDCSQYMKKK